ncbi:MAG TPA: glycosyltransferase [Anaerolineae bacterium]|nr:glycosyltransferase [Anaerolineae bacterium]
MSQAAETIPLVSVFIPTYNAGQFLAQAIESVLAQTFANYELIVVDDASTDDTAGILKQYQGHPKITIQQNPQNVGMAANWNVGLRLCRGHLIAKLDADDFYEPGYLEAVVKVFQQDQAVGLVFSGLNLIYPDGRIEPEMPFLRSWVRQPKEFLPALLQACMLRSPTVCVRRSCYDQWGGFNKAMQIHADWEMWVRIAAQHAAGFIARRLANYRMSYGSNCTAQAALDGRSIRDLQLWLKLLAEDRLPYRLSATELHQFKWGLYHLEMHFAATAAYYGQEEMRQAYTAFAEEVMPDRPSAVKLERMRQVYTNLHQGICAFRENHLPEARRYFLQGIRSGPEYCKSFWIWSKLLLTFMGRTKWGILDR